MDPIKKVGNARVDTWETGLGALVTERYDADLRPRAVLVQHQRAARVTLIVKSITNQRWCVGQRFDDTTTMLRLFFFSAKERESVPGIG